MRRDSVLVLATRGLVSALETWKAVLLFLLLNAVLAAAFLHPLASALHTTLDKSPWADRLGASDADLHTFFSAFTRTRPDVLGDLEKWDEAVTGERDERGPSGKTAPLSGFFGTTGLSGSAVAYAALAALLAALFSGGFAGRFGAERDRADLSAFGADAARFAVPSLLFGALSLAGILAAYRWVYAAPGTLYEPDELRYEWEATGLLLLRLGAFLLVAGYLRLVVVYARAAMGQGATNPFAALMSALGFVLRRPARTLAIEIAFGVLGVLPLAAWAFLGPVWNGVKLGDFALILAGQQLVVALRILTRVGHLGAASAYLKRSREPVSPAPAPSLRVAPESSNPRSAEEPAAVPAP
ncbi:MAG: hypothetical protein NEA02_14065 [Thermoanaerobaculia bacterium]|nr:hypothetical protein [Thermoanaerobaculia bacterium]